MKTPQGSRICRAFGALAAAALVAACSGGPQSLLNASGPLASSASVRAKGADTVSTVVGIKNDWTNTILGAGSATCWSISPSLPSVGAGDLSDPITLSYTPSCPATSTLKIVYGPETNPASDCTFNVTSNGTTFTYTVTQGADTACTVAPSASSRYDEILTYAQLTPGLKKKPA
jgi:hypothetical protein